MPERILVVRFGAMGDILHTLPAVSSLRAEWPRAEIRWLVDPRWTPLLDGNPDVTGLIPLDRRRAASLWSGLRSVTAGGFDLAIDFQGLLKSAIPARLSRARRRIGFAPAFLREKQAAWFYTETVAPRGRHVVDANLDLAIAAGATRRIATAPIPPGRPEGELPREPFVLVSPLAGWGSKQWPLARYGELAAILRERFGMPLVVNGAPDAAAQLGAIPGARLHLSALPGLIDATRRAAAVIGVDSGPMHLAAALGKPGVAIFGPTDPERNGPYGGSLEVIRAAGAETTYKRGSETAPSMSRVSVEEVAGALSARLTAKVRPGR